MEFDLQRAAVVAGDGIVARYAGVLCVARCPDPEPLRTLLELCAAAAGEDPGVALSRSLAKWLASADDIAGELAFGTVAQAGEQLAVFLNGPVAVEIVADRQRFSGTDAAAWTDRLLPPPDSPVVLALHDAMAGGATMSHLGLLDLQRGVVPGAGVVLRAERGGDAGRSATTRSAAPEHLDRSPLAPDVDRSPGNGRSVPVPGSLGAARQPASQSMPQPMSPSVSQPMARSGSQPVSPSASQPMSQSVSPSMARPASPPVEPTPLRAVAEPARSARAGRDRKLAAVPEPGPEPVHNGNGNGSRAGDWFRPEPEPDAAARFGAEFAPEYGPELESEFPVGPGGDPLNDPLDVPLQAPVRDPLNDPLGPGGAWIEPGAHHPGRHSVHDRGDDHPAERRSGPHQQVLSPERLVNGAAVGSGDEAPTPSRGDAVAVRQHDRDEQDDQDDQDERERALGDGSGQGVPAPRSAARVPRRAETVIGLQPTEQASVAELFRSAADDGGEALEEPGEPVSLGLLRWDDGAVYTLDGEYLVGRMPESDERVRAGDLRSIVVEDRSGAVSRVHAEIRLDGREVLLIDSGSRNGTFVAGPGQQGWTPITPGHSQRLGAGTRVRMGGRTFVFEAAGIE